MRPLSVFFLPVILYVTASPQDKAGGIMKADSERTVAAEIKDMKCYTSGMMGGRGQEHEDCAIACIKNGHPVGFVEDKNDSVFLIAPAKGMNGANQNILPYVAKHVSVNGKVFEKAGVTIQTYSSIEELK